MRIMKNILIINHEFIQKCDIHQVPQKLLTKLQTLCTPKPRATRLACYALSLIKHLQQLRILGCHSWHTNWHPIRSGNVRCTNAAKDGLPLHPLLPRNHLLMSL